MKKNIAIVLVILILVVSGFFLSKTWFSESNINIVPFPRDGASQVGTGLTDNKTPQAKDEGTLITSQSDLNKLLLIQDSSDVVGISQEIIKLTQQTNGIYDTSFTKGNNLKIPEVASNKDIPNLSFALLKVVDSLNESEVSSEVKKDYLSCNRYFEKYLDTIMTQGGNEFILPKNLVANGFLNSDNPQTQGKSYDRYSFFLTLLYVYPKPITDESLNSFFNSSESNNINYFFEKKIFLELKEKGTLKEANGEYYIPVSEDEAKIVFKDYINDMVFYEDKGVKYTDIDRGDQLDIFFTNYVLGKIKKDQFIEQICSFRSIADTNDKEK